MAREYTVLNSQRQVALGDTALQPGDLTHENKREQVKLPREQDSSEDTEPPLLLLHLSKTINGQLLLGLGQKPGALVVRQVGNDDPAYLFRLAIHGSACKRARQNLTKDDDGKSHDGDNDEQPSPGGQTATAIKRREKARLNPSSSHATQVTKDAEDGSAGAEL